jgi:hypothetical protein
VRECTTLAFTNTIIAGHSFAGVRGTSGSTVTLDYTLWHDNGTMISGGVVVTNTHVVNGDLRPIGAGYDVGADESRPFFLPLVLFWYDEGADGNLPQHGIGGNMPAY